MRLIDADELKEIAHEMIQEDPDAFNGGYSYNAVTVDEIDEAPTIEAVPVVWGYNNNQNYHETDEFRCSVCGLHLEDWSRRTFDKDTGDEFFVEYVFKYCPECGAKMKGGAE